MLVTLGRSRRALIAATLVAGGACSSTPAPPAPAPVPRPSDAERAARADSARLRARADSIRAAQLARTVRASPGARYAALARPAARNDTLAPRELHTPIRVCAGGDVTLGTNLDTAWARIAAAKMRATYGLRDDPESLLAPLRPFFREATVALVNVESAIGEGDAPSKCSRRSTHCFAFRSPPASAAALRALAPDRVVVGNIANNHARDAGAPGYDSTVAALKRQGVVVTGADTLATIIPMPSGDTIAVLGFYTSPDTPDARDTAAVRRHVQRAADRYPLVIATMHLGAEGRDAQNTRDSSERYLGIDRGNPVAFADAAVRGGAALVVGHGPHVIRAVEWRNRGALIAYSLGNLLTYGPFLLKEPLNRGGVLCTVVDRSGRVSSASLAATMQRAPGVLEPDPTRRAVVLTDSLGQVDFPATAARLDPGGALRPSEPR
jgi:hypothetical protein